MKGRALTHGHVVNGKPSRTYRVWQGMIQRCTNRNTPAWSYYGGRGISVCEQWRSFIGFLADMGEAPEGMTLDRIDTDGNYESANCRWATHAEQMRNRRPFDQRGGRNPNAVLDQKAVSEIRKLAGTMTQAKLAAGFGVSQATISNILSRRSW